MNTWVIIALIGGFILGYFLGKTNRHRRGKVIKRFIITIFAVIFTILTIMGLISFVSPTMFISIIELLPRDIQNKIIADMILRGHSVWWIFAIIAGILWWLRTRIR